MIIIFNILIQTLRAFRLANPGGLEACRHGGLGQREVRGWKMGASGLENWSLGVQNGSWDLQIGAKMGPGRPKLELGGSRYLQNWILDGLEAGLEGLELPWTAILGVQGPVWTPSWGHLGAPGGVSGAILDNFGVPNGSGKAILWIWSRKVQNSKIIVFSVGFLMILEVRGLWKSIKMGSSGYQNRCEMAGGPKTCILEAEDAVLGAILASQNLPKWNLGGLQGGRRTLTQARVDGGGSNFFRFRPPKID